MTEPLVTTAPLDDDALIRILAAIKDMALSIQPYSNDGRSLDPDLVISLGEIAGKAGAALGRYQRRALR